MNTLFPIIYSLVIFLFPFVGKFHYNRQTLNSIVISLGLLGTFIGIIYSLLHFDPENISISLPQLLAGLKITILTIISSIITSLLLKLFPVFYGIRKEKNTIIENLPETMKEILHQLIAIKENIHKTGIIQNPDGTVQATELFQDKALYDLARNTSQIMQKQSQYLSITQEENKRLYEQLQQLLQASQTTNENLTTLLEKGIRNEENRSVSEPPTPVMKEILQQLIAIKENIHKTGTILHPDGTVQATELFQDKALYDLAHNTSQIMQKQSQYLSITQEENKRLYEQLQQLLQASQTTNENLTTLLEKGIRNEENRSVSEPPTPVMKEILQQLIAIKENIHKTGTILHPDGTVQATELFQDKALYDLARNTSQIMQKQSQYLSISQEENRRLYERLETLLTVTEATNKNLETLLEKGINRGNKKITAQVDELSQLVKSTGEQVTVQIKQINEKRAKEAKELMQFTQTLQNIIKKLNQSHNALYKSPEEQ